MSQRGPVLLGAVCFPGGPSPGFVFDRHQQDSDLSEAHSDADLHRHKKKKKKKTFLCLLLGQMPMHQMFGCFMLSQWSLRLSLLLFYSFFFILGFPCGSAGKESACSAEDLCLIPGSGRSRGERNGKSLQYSCLENPMDRGSWWATYGIARVGHDLATKPPPYVK